MVLMTAVPCHRGLGACLAIGGPTRVASRERVVAPIVRPGVMGPGEAPASANPCTTVPVTVGDVRIMRRAISSLAAVAVMAVPLTARADLILSPTMPIIGGT